MNSGSFITDTATLCVFDLAAIRHRLDDRGDWWSVPDDEILEVNSGNVAFVGLGDDGQYEFRIEGVLTKETCVVILNCPSGHLFIGAAEEVTADGLEPEAIRGGMFWEVIPGKYRLAISRVGSRSLSLSFSGFEGKAENCFTAPIRI